MIRLKSIIIIDSMDVSIGCFIFRDDRFIGVVNLIWKYV